MLGGARGFNRHPLAPAPHPPLIEMGRVGQNPRDFSVMAGRKAGTGHSTENKWKKMKIRRVVTGHSADGRAIVASDTALDALTVALLPGMEFHRLWGADVVPTFPDDGSPYPSLTYFPPLGGFRFGLFTLPPDGVVPATPVDTEAAQKEAEEKLPGLLAYLEPDQPGMHTTETIDFEYVVSGEVWLELDDGVEMHLRAGDTVVQNGTRHAWRNRGSDPCQWWCVYRSPT